MLRSHNTKATSKQTAKMKKHTLKHAKNICGHQAKILLTQQQLKQLRVGNIQHSTTSSNAIYLIKEYKHTQRDSMRCSATKKKGKKKVRSWRIEENV